MAWSKEEIAEYNRQYYQKNKEKIVEERAMRKEERAESNRQYREKNREKINEQKKKHYYENKEKIAEKQKKYRYENREKIKEYEQSEKGKKSSRIRNWKKSGVINNDFYALYEYYLDCKNCESCNVELTEDKITTATTRVLDHDHETGLFRNVLCNLCNVKRK